MADNAFTVVDSKPEPSPIILGITAPSGAGKTLSALRLAHGIREVVGGDIVILDTEGKRSARYSSRPGFKFKRIDFAPPYSSDRYTEALDTAYAAGAKTIIVDSMSHEHEGIPGGYLDYHEREIDKMLGTKRNDYKERQKMTFSGWIQPAAARRRLINRFLQIPANFIFCFRAKEKIRVVSGGAPIQLGWQAIAGDELVYEMIARCLLLPGAKGVPDWSAAAFAHNAAKLDDQDRHLFPEGEELSEAIGRKIAETYSPTGTPITARLPTTPEDRINATKDALSRAADQGNDALAEEWGKLAPKQQAFLQAFYDKDLKQVADMADDDRRPRKDDDKPQPSGDDGEIF